MRGFTDVHHHLVYGLDDGAKTFEQAMTMAAAADAAGTATLIATPHVLPGIRPFDEALYHRRVERLQAACRKRGMGLRLLEGAEILYTEQTCRMLREGRIPTLGGSGWVLVEFLPQTGYRDLCDALAGILRTGYRPVIAHVERYRCLDAAGRRLRELRRAFGAVAQMNCSTVLGGKGWLQDWRSRRWLDEGFVDLVATDAHNVTSRPTRMREAYALLEARYGQAYARRLTGLDNPRSP